MTENKVAELAALLDEMAAYWNLFLGQLGVPQGKLDQIQLQSVGQPKVAQYCLTRGLHHWVVSDESPTYETIIAVLNGDFLPNKPLARKVEVFASENVKTKPTHQPCDGEEFFDAVEIQLDECESFARCRKYLQEYYKSKPMAPAEDTKWPPTPNKHYINLAYISKEGTTRQQADEFTKNTIEGDVDEILREKKPMSMRDIAKLQPDDSYPKLVLVEGAPGVGKTTFSWELCRRWAEGELLQHYSLVVVLRCRDKRVREAKTIDDLLFRRRRKVIDSVLQDMDTNLGKGVLIIIEGYDELPAQLREQKDSVFSDLIDGSELPCATVLVTSRPSATCTLKQCQRMTQHIEILGFTKKQLQLYLKSCMSETEVLAKLQHYLKLRPQIHAAMYIPLNAAIVVRVYQESGELPETMTELYKALSRSILIRYQLGGADSSSIPQGIKDFSDFPKETLEQFLKLCKLAYEGICNNQQLIFTDLPEDFETLGFMQSVTELYVSQGASVSYNFLHLTIQEFLAAYHIFKLPPEQWIEHFKRNGIDFKVVLMFVAGLTKLNDQCLRKYLFQRYLDNSNGETIGHYEFDDERVEDILYPISLYYDSRSEIFRYIFEAQNPTVIHSVQTTIIYYGLPYDMAPFDYHAFGYCLRSSLSWLLQLPPNDKDISDEDLLLMKSGYVAGKLNGCGSVVAFYSKGLCHTKFLQCLLELLEPYQLKELYFDRLDKPTINVLSSSLRRHRNLKAVKFVEEFGLPVLVSLDNPLIRSLPTCLSFIEFNSIKIDLAECQLLSKYLETSQTIEILKVCRCHFNNTGINEFLHESILIQGVYAYDSSEFLELCDGIKKNRSLKYLDMSWNMMSVESFTCLASMLSHNQPPLTGLRLKDCGITTQGAVEMFQSLSDTSNITRLDLSVNPSIGSEGIIALAGKIAQVSLHLTSLNLSGCGIGEDAAAELVHVLNNTRITTLNLSRNSVGDSVVTGLVRLLDNSNSLLSRLELVKCSITPQGGTEIAQAMCSNTTLKKLDLSENELSMDVLATILQHNPGLTDLHVYCCRIKIQSAEHILKLLCSNGSSQLRRLDIAGDVDSELKFWNIHTSEENQERCDFSKELILKYNPKPLEEVFYGNHMNCNIAEIFYLWHLQQQARGAEAT